ncbi:MAG: ketoacyl-ACP synthase III [Fibrobacter sp.]|nr:ketoacyl-ACP synthase III [Fibrobacter sp.]
MANLQSARIISVGTYVPENVVTNKDLEKIVNTTDEWIFTRSGIRERHIVPMDSQVSASELGAKAAIIAIERAGLKPVEIDGIICATFTPDSFFPSTACRIQAIIGCSNAFAFDVSAACAGFVYALTVADGLIKAGRNKNVLVIGTEVISKVLDWTDRSTCVLFGDGAGAVVLQASEDTKRGILSTHLTSDGTLGDILKLPAWGEKRTMQMKGNDVFKHAVRMMSEAAYTVLGDAGYGLDRVDYLIPHQANIRIIQAVAELLKLPKDKVVTNLEHFGNTSSASIPLALDEVWGKGLIKNDTMALFTALGGGITAGSVLCVF